MHEGDMLRLALQQCNKPPKAVARDCGYSDDAIYAAMNGARPIPTQARAQISKLNPLAGLAVAFEATGWQIFKYLKVDRHVQSLLQRLFKEDQEADEAINALPWLLLDKQKEDLTTDDRNQIRLAAKEMLDRVICELNLLVELDTQYDLHVMDFLAQKEKTAHKRAAN